MRIIGKFQFIVFLSIFYFTNQIEVYIYFLIFAIIHEIGHMVVGILMGRRIEQIELMPLGVNVSFRIIVEDYNEKIIKGNISNIKNLLIAVAGPFVNFAIAIIFYNLKMLNIEVIDWYYTEIIIYINLLIGFFNLIPIYPLDGGRVLQEILYVFLGKRKALEEVNKISKISIIILTIFSSIFLFAFKNIAILFIIIYLWMLVVKENKKYKALKSLYTLIDKICS